MADGNQLLKHLPGQLHDTIRARQVPTVSGGPTLLESPEGPLRGRKDFLVYNGSAETIYVGGADVTVASGIPVAAGGSWGAQLGRAKLYATVSGADVTGGQIRIMEIS